jgi:hypothetical protein
LRHSRENWFSSGNTLLTYFFEESMNPEETKRMTELVNQIQVEKNQKIFIALVEELNELLKSKEVRLSPRVDGGSSAD